MFTPTHRHTRTNTLYEFRGGFYWDQDGIGYRILTNRLIPLDAAPVSTVEDLQAKLNGATQEIERLQKQLPPGMEHCTILFERCPQGHGYLRGRNWVKHPCFVCKYEFLLKTARTALKHYANTAIGREANNALNTIEQSEYTDVSAVGETQPENRWGRPEPTVSGFYWYRQAEGACPTVFEVRQQVKGLCYHTGQRWERLNVLRELCGQWGPRITPPSEA